MRPHAVVGVAAIAGCAAFKAEPLTDSDAAAMVPEAGTSDASGRDASDPDAPSASSFCRTSGRGAAVCEDFDQASLLADWTAPDAARQFFTLEKSEWVSSPHAGRLRLDRTAERDLYFSASRKLSPASVIEVELDFLKREGDERIFAIATSDAVFLQFDTIGNVEVGLGQDSTSETLHAEEAPGFGSAFVHVRAVVDLSARSVEYVIGSVTCVHRDLPVAFKFEGETKFVLAAYMSAAGPRERIEFVWDNILVRTTP